MAQALTQAQADQLRLARGSPVIVELVGPAGSGKTTISHLLSGCDPGVIIAPDIELRKASHVTRFLKHVPFWAPVYLHGTPSNRQLSWSELKYITYLREWSGMLRRQAPNAGRIVLLDHGPIFRLATLWEFGPHKLNSPAFEKWWESLYRQWAFGLDVIVWLDTDDATLMERINARRQRHDMKGRPASETANFLMRYRLSYRHTLERLMQYRQPRLLQFDTSLVPIENITREILAACRS